VEAKVSVKTRLLDCNLISVQDLPSLAQSIVSRVHSNILAFGILMGLNIKYFARFRIDEVLVFVNVDLVPTTVGLPDSKVAIIRL